ncbi:DUF1549 domain-containing protein [Planctomyces sp. SH-PL62]|uniref:DUF1549 domain-containing protein n=1 Tax=Planctomyces sp. SH-PL62 TaxID=1636152 RepID=UPI00078CC756|nr:DUF1549 domain-containing protein [Planctomyces sp. SH-PL62]AMV37939.1 hypothetical protein VT85_10920 [Planctomyces sp. SH-PL62]
MRLRDVGFICVLVGCVLAMGRGVIRPASPTRQPTDAPAPRPEVAAQVDEAFRESWRERGIKPAPPASDLAVLRRLNLALTGTVPSLEEVRRFEAEEPGRRIDDRLEELLRDRRTTDYLAERFARAFVGTEDGPFIVFRRRRFTTWLSDALMENRPYSAIVRDLIAERGIWTDHPAVNFLTVTRDEMTERPDPERLAARVSRAFLAARIDCAQCHDHPFQPWKQDDFRRLAAFFGGIRSNLRGVSDAEDIYHPLDRKTKEPTTVEAAPPSHPELLPAEGAPRERLAAWVVDPRNPYFARATVNRVWAILVGRPLVDPIDDIPAAAETPAPLDLLADDFAAHGHDLRRLIRAIVATEAYRLDSVDLPDEAAAPNDETWAAFPMTRLRPEQVAGGLTQSASVETMGPRVPWFARAIAYAEGNDFVRRYGDAGEDEFESRGGTIPQRLLLMNGELVEKRTKAEFWNASKRIADLAPTDEKAVELAYLAVLTRRPTPEEAAHFAPRLQGTSGDARSALIVDLFWTLLNSAEFSWNH